VQFVQRCDRIAGSVSGYRLGTLNRSACADYLCTEVRYLRIH
jgi:hypothetical protein